MHDFKKMEILITGGTGFLGRRLVEELLRRGYERGTAVGRDDADLRDLKDARELVATHRPAVIFHLAALCGGIGANRANPSRFGYENLQMGLNLLEAAVQEGRTSKPIRFVMVGTTCSYPAFPPRIPFHEDDLWAGYPEPTNAPYGIAKRVLLEHTRTLTREGLLDGVCPVLANLYGLGDNFDLETSHVVPAIIRKMTFAMDAGVPLHLWGTGKPTRDLLYVDDAARGLVDALERAPDAEPINLGTGVETSIAEIVAIAAEVVGFQESVFWDPSKPNGQERRVLDTTRAMMRLDWRATTRLEDGIRKVVQSWKNA